MEFKKEEINKICELYNEVGDLCMLYYIKELNLTDTKAISMLDNMLELNDKMLDTTLYYDYRREFLSYLGFTWDDDGMLLYGKVDNKGKISELDIKSLAFTKVKREIETSFQDLENMKKIIEFNKQENYIYTITSGKDNNLLDSEVICYLTNQDYVIVSKYTDKEVVFKHKKLIEREQEENEEIKEKRGY